MFNEKILEVIATTPGCREAAIYDAVSVDADETRAAISVLETSGAIVAIESEGVTECGRVFEFTEEFKATDAWKRITLKATAAKMPGTNRIERAIAFVKERGTATSAELHSLMGLPPDELASNVLAGAVRTKRLVKNGKHWTLGPGPGGPAAPALPVDEDREPTRVTWGSKTAPFPVPMFLQKEAKAAEASDAATFKAEEELTPPSAAAVPAPVDNVVSLEPQRTARIKPMDKIDFAAFADMVNSQATPGTAPAIRCGLWSDGSVEVQRDGKTSAVLAVEEVACLADFWGRIKTSAKEAS
jgi:hypothetical protein